MKSLILALIALVAVAGCAQPLLQHGIALVTPDLQASQQVLAGSASLLPPGDPWLLCNKALQTLNAELLKGPGLQVSGGLLITEATRLHILDVMIQTLPVAVKASCGEALMQLLVRAGTRLPGL